jgi:signal peptidase I
MYQYYPVEIAHIDASDYNVPMQESPYVRDDQAVPDNTSANLSDLSDLSENVSDSFIEGIALQEWPRLQPRRVFLREMAGTLLLVVSIYCVVNLATARYVVEGASMEPNFHNDQLIVVNRAAYIFGAPARGDVIVFHDPEDPAHDFIKRVIGLPNEVIEIRDGRVFVNHVKVDEPYIPQLCEDRHCDGVWTTDPEHYFVLGDNRSHSHDSHSFGPLDRSLIIGQAQVRYWPPSDWGVIPHYEYRFAGNGPPTAPTGPANTVQR